MTEPRNWLDLIEKQQKQSKEISEILNPAYRNTMEYKLLKDLPDCNAGALLIWNEEKDGYILFGRTESIFQSKKIVENNPDWFTPVTDLDSIIEQEINSFNPLKPDIKMVVRNSAKTIAEKYLSNFKQQLIAKLEKDRPNINQTNFDKRIIAEEIIYITNRFSSLING